MFKLVCHFPPIKFRNRAIITYKSLLRNLPQKIHEFVNRSFEIQVGIYDSLITR